VATYIAHGDVALSVLMTTASTLGAIFMTPLLTKMLAGTLVPVNAMARPHSPTSRPFQHITNMLVHLASCLLGLPRNLATGCAFHVRFSMSV